MDLFPHSVGAADSPSQGSGAAATTGLTMAYYDGNTVTALWNYAQHYAMSDRFFGTTFGPSTLGALNLVSGQTNGVVNDGNAAGNMVSDGNGGFTLTRNAAPVNDICSSTSGALVHMMGRNVGDLLNAAAITWGFFHEGFDTSVTQRQWHYGLSQKQPVGCYRTNTVGLHTGRESISVLCLDRESASYAARVDFDDRANRGWRHESSI